MRAFLGETMTIGETLSAKEPMSSTADERPRLRSSRFSAGSVPFIPTRSPGTSRDSFRLSLRATRGAHCGSSRSMSSGRLFWELFELFMTRRDVFDGLLDDRSWDHCGKPLPIVPRSQSTLVPAGPAASAPTDVGVLAYRKTRIWRVAEASLSRASATA